MSKFLTERLQQLNEYVPGEQPRDKSYIKLNTNESPFPPSNEVIKAANEQQLLDLNLYSDPDCVELTKEFSKLYQINTENVIFGNGSDEILNYCFMAYFAERKKVAFPDITYGFYKVFGDLYNSDYSEIPLDENLNINFNNYINLNSGIIIANPNAPTGTYFENSIIEKIVSSNQENIVIVDEAYIDFGGKSAYKLCDKYDNLIVVGTFSKSRSLAGARLGFAIGNKTLISDLQRIKFSTNPYNINRLTQVIGYAALNSDAYYKQKCKTIISNREFTINELEKLNFKVIPSKSNFVFAENENYSGEELYIKLKQNGILVRHFKNERIKNYLRITIGTKEQMVTLIDVLSQII